MPICTLMGEPERPADGRYRHRSGKTIAAFIRCSPSAIKAVFQEVLLVCDGVTPPA
jgi:hypothetical protein